MEMINRHLLASNPRESGDNNSSSYSLQELEDAIENYQQEDTE